MVCSGTCILYFCYKARQLLTIILAPERATTLFIVSGTAGGVGLVLIITIVTVGIVTCRKFRVNRRSNR